MDSCRAKIVRYYRSLPPGTLFTTRDCLGVGLRYNVDQALARLVKEGLLVRIVRGMFVCALTRRPHYSDLEIATLKAKSFGKRILQHGANAAADMGLKIEKTAEPTFIVNGATSKFRVIERHQTINLRTACHKKMQLKDDRAGTVVRSLWQLGKKKITREAIIRALAVLKKEDCQLIINSCAWMPYWLSNIFIIVFQNRYRKDFKAAQMPAT